MTDEGLPEEIEQAIRNLARAETRYSDDIAALRRAILTGMLEARMDEAATYRASMQSYRQRVDELRARAKAIREGR